MKKEESLVAELFERYPILTNSKEDLLNAYRMICDCYKKGGKLLVAGNGGSCADADHITGELMKSFCMKRPIDASMAARLVEIDEERGRELANNLEKGLPTFSLGYQGAFLSAFSNDVCNVDAIAQQIMALGKKGDVFWGISTSGKSENIMRAAIVAKASEIKVITLIGPDVTKLYSYSDVCIRVDGEKTHEIQELHLPIYHCLCRMVEEHFFGKTN